MGDLQIGRAGSSIDMAHPSSIQWRPGSQGMGIVISGHLKDTTTLAEAKILRDQLVQQVKRKGTTGFVAVYSTVDPTINGYYILDSASVTASHSLGSLVDTGFFTYQASLSRLDTVLFETVVTGTVLTNDHSKTTGNTENILMIAAGSTSLYPFGAGLSWIRRVDPAPFSSIPPSDSVIGPYDFVPPDIFVWSVSPRFWYGGAVALEVGGHIVAGRPVFDDEQVDAVGGTYDPPLRDGDWRLTNGAIRIGNLGSFDELNLVIECWDDVTATWESSTEFELQQAGGDYSQGGWSHMIVLRNDTEEVAIRLISKEGAGIGRTTLDISLRRGMHFARCYLTETGQSTSSLGVKRISTDAATSFTYGVHDATNDPDGNRWILGSRQTVTKDTTNGAITKTGLSGGDNFFDFFIGMEIHGTSAVVHNQATDIGDQYLYHIASKTSPILPGGALP